MERSRALQTMLMLTLLLLLWPVVTVPTMGSPLLPTTSPTLHTSPLPEDLSTQPSITESGSFNSSHTSKDGNHTSAPTNTTPPSSTRLARCRYEFKETIRNELYEVSGVNVPLKPMLYFVAANESRCYLTRQDMESRLNASATADVIVIFAVNCLNPQGTEVVYLDDDEAEDLEASYRSSANNATLPPLDGEEEEGEEEGGRRGSAKKNESSHHYYQHVISYFQSKRCRINLQGPDMIANMSELRVFTMFGERSLNLSELQDKPELCRLFRNVVAFGMSQDWSTQSQLPYLTLCADHLLNVVEMDFTNNSLTVFPEELSAAMPNLRALLVSENNMTAPVPYPWASGFAALPRNLSRNYHFNLDYSFKESFDMPPNLFRRIFVLDGNRITNLTHFRFHSQFQYISVQRNGLREIAAGVFDDVTSLQFLSLADNELESLPVSLFSRLHSLRRLDLQGNRLVTLPTDIFVSVRKLERLNVERNRLQLIQDGLFRRLEELQEVKLKNNSILEVQKDSFTTLSVKLKVLELQNNPLKTFPTIVLVLGGLVTTNLENTDIEVLDFVQIARQTSLSVLSASLKNPTTGQYLNLKENPEYQKFISLRRSKLRSVVVYEDTRETLPIFLLVIKYYTIQVEDSRLACDCHILNVTHQLQAWEADGTLTGEEACLSGWKCIWPAELSGKGLSSLKDEDTYCPLADSHASGTGGSGNTSCPEGCTCYLRTKVNTVIVDCQNGGLTALPESVPDNTRELWLQNNTIQSLEKRPYLPLLHALKLTSNNVKDLPIDVFLHMPQLTVLYLDDNWLTGLKPDFAKLRQLRELRLAGNPFRCDCTTLWLKDWILRHQMIMEDWAAIKCTTEDDDGQVFTAVPDHRFVCTVAASLSQLALPIALPVSLALLLLVAGVLAFIQRRRLKVLLYIHTGYHPFDRDPPDARALYDVSVVCDVTARAWVLRHVIERLEEGGRYKVFFYSRDSYAGFTITDNVRHCVKNSKRLVVVLAGKDWQRNELLVTAVHEGLAKCLKDMPHFLTLLLHNLSAKDIDNKDLRQYIQGGRYISTEDKHFAKKLLYEMPHVKNARNLQGGEKAARRPKKGEAPRGPEPVPMYDIMAIGADGDLDGWEGGEADPKDDVGYIRQVSEQEVDVDLRQNGVEQNNVVKGQNNYHHEQQQQQLGVLHLRNHDDGDAGRHRDGQVNGGVMPRARLQNQTSRDSQRSQQHQQPRTIFVWYADADLEYTLTAIVEPLEQRGHRCVLQDRDFPLGAAIQENIVHAAETSTRCIFVLSDRTPENDWFNFAFHVAFDRHLQSRDHRMALVSREEVEVARFSEEVQQVIRTSALLQESDPWFWKRLKTFVCLDQVEL